MKRLLSVEPVLISNLVKAIVVILVAWGLPLTGDQTAAIIGIVIPTLALTGAVTRQVVAPVTKVAEVLQKPVEVVNDVLKEVKL